MIKVILADDHKILREGLKQIIEASGIKVIAEASDYEETIEILERLTADILILDISMPGRNGLDIMKAITKKNIAIKVLVLSMYSEEEYAERMLKAGAKGYMEKKCAALELVKAIHEVCKGNEYISDNIRNRIQLDTTKHDPAKLHDALSDREYEVMLKIAKALTVSEIAAELNLSVKTISTYRERIIIKTGLQNNAEIMKYVIENGLTR